MGLFRRRSPVGVTRQNMPDLHLTDDASTVQLALEDGGDEFRDERPHTIAPATRSWRTGSQGTHRPDVALSDTAEARAAAHADRGDADPRRADKVPAGNPAAPEAPYSPSMDRPRNVREDVVIGHKPAPVRPRQGWTGEDPTRAARFQTAFLLRPFDKGIAEHPGAIDKAPMPAPHAARPPERKRLIGGRPSPTGTSGTGMTPVGSQPNTFRTAPGPWDEKIVTTRVSPTRARGWRAK